MGRRLGYVFLDTIWLLTHDADTNFIAELLLAQMQGRPQEWQGEQWWSQHLATVGARLLPVLEDLALRTYDKNRDQWIPRNIPLALAEIADGDREAVTDLIGELLVSDNEGGIEVALNAARRVSAPQALDVLWDFHIQREIAFDQCAVGPDFQDERIRLFRRRSASSEAIRTAVGSDSDWLNRKIGNTHDGFELNQLLWILVDSNHVNDDDAREIWIRHREHLLRIVHNDSKAMIEALGCFGDIDDRTWLDTVSQGGEDSMSSRIIRSRARLDPPTALQEIRDRNEDFGWSAVDWWLPELVWADPVGLSEAIRENASKGDDPLTDTILYYSNYPELMDEITLDWVLDEFGPQLQTFNRDNGSKPDAKLGRLGHPLRFLPSLVEPRQFECVARRAGTLLEEELIRFACRRTGRTSRYRDSEGAQCERLLAMIDGTGFEALVVAELDRSDPFGREDGYSAALWVESDAVTKALQAVSEVHDSDGYRQVIRMQALAVRVVASRTRMGRPGRPFGGNSRECEQGRRPAYRYDPLLFQLSGADG